MGKKVVIDDEIIQEINSKIKKSRIRALIIAAVLLIIPIGLWLITRDFMDVIMVGVMVLIVDGFLIFSLPAYTKAKLLKQKIVPLAVKQAFGSKAIYNARGGIDSNVLKRMALFKVYTLSQEDYISAEFEGVKFICADVDSYQIVKSGDSTRKEYYFQGMVLITDFNKPFNGEVVIKENDYSGGRVGKSLEEFETESIDFNKSYKGYATNKHLGFYVITPQLIERLNKIRRLIKGGFCFKFCSDKLYIAISGAKNHLEGKNMKKISADVLEQLVKELEPIKTIIGELNLDTSYFRDVDEVINEAKTERKKASRIKEEVTNN